MSTPRRKSEAETDETKQVKTHDFPASTLIEVRDLILEMLVRGDDREEIVEFIHEQYPKAFTNVGISYEIEHVKKEMVKMVDSDLLTMILRHVYVYERLYKKFNQVNFKGGARRALKQKEKLLGLVDQDFTIEVFNMKQGSGESLGDLYDLDKLTPEEREEFNLLLLKIKIPNGQALQLPQFSGQSGKSSSPFTHLDNFLSSD